MYGSLTQLKNRDCDHEEDPLEAKPMVWYGPLVQHGTRKIRIVFEQSTKKPVLSISGTRKFSRELQASPDALGATGVDHIGRLVHILL